MIKQIEQTISSLEVAEMVEKEHKYLLRDIKNINERKIALVKFIKKLHTLAGCNLAPG